MDLPQISKFKKQTLPESQNPRNGGSLDIIGSKISMLQMKNLKLPVVKIAAEILKWKTVSKNDIVFIGVLLFSSKLTHK